jgi:transcriptional regulator with XRE-family HTH domain
MAKSQHAHRYAQLPGLLRQLREDAGLTQRELAQKLLVTHVFVHKSEVGDRRVDVAEFIDWSLACGVDPVQSIKQLRQLRGGT